jgi:hypothetical protein
MPHTAVNTQSTKSSAQFSENPAPSSAIFRKASFNAVKGIRSRTGCTESGKLFFEKKTPELMVMKIANKLATPEIVAMDLVLAAQSMANDVKQAAPRTLKVKNASQFPSTAKPKIKNPLPIIATNSMASEMQRPKM